MHRCALIALLLAACGQQPGPVRTTVHAAVSDAPAGPHAVVVFATSSLRRPFEALAERYEQDHPGSDVQLHFDGGAQLLAKMGAGETCDVLAIGDSSQMSRFSSAGHLAVGSPTELARSRIAIVVTTGNPKQVHGLADLAAQVCASPSAPVRPRSRSRGKPRSPRGRPRSGRVPWRPQGSSSFATRASCPSARRHREGGAAGRGARSTDQKLITASKVKRSASRSLRDPSGNS